MNISKLCKNVAERFETDIGNGFSVEYTLYENIFENRLSYSIKVTLKNNGESAIARDVTSDPDLARHIFGMIRRGGVTPCCLFEVVEDLIESTLEVTPHEKVLSTSLENTL